MTTLGDSMVKALFGQTEAEKTFRPWWDNLEDVLLYGLIIVGKFYQCYLTYYTIRRSDSDGLILNMQYNFSIDTIPNIYCIKCSA